MSTADDPNQSSGTSSKTDRGFGGYDGTWEVGNRGDRDTVKFTEVNSEAFQKGTTNPETLYPVDITDKTPDEIVLLSVLQGVVAKHNSTQLYLYTTKDSSYQPTKSDKEKGLTTGLLFFKDYLTNTRDPKIKIQSDVKTETSEIVSYFKKHIKGYVIYELKKDSQDMAATYCGIENCIPVTENNKKIATDLGLVEMENLTNNPDTNKPITYSEFIAKYGKSINRNFAIELALTWGVNPPKTKADGPKDYASMLSGMVFYSYGSSDTRNLVLDFLTQSNSKPAPIYGWNADSGTEGKFVTDVSTKGDFVVASDNSVNLSFFSSSNIESLKTKSPATLTYDANKSYVTFIISDGDNLQLVTNKANDERWWGNSNRGKFPVGWTIPPSLYYLEPDVWNYFIKTSTDNDELVVGPSGLGFIFGSVTKSQSKYEQQQKYLESFMNDSGIKTVCVFGDTSQDWENDDFLGANLNNPAVQGVFYSQFRGWMSQQEYSTKWIGSNNKPIIPENIYLNSQSSAVTAADKINTKLRSINNGFYAAYAQRNDGDDTMDWLNFLNDQLDKSNVQVVSPSQLINLAIQARDS